MIKEKFVYICEFKATTETHSQHTKETWTNGILKQFLEYKSLSQRDSRGTKKSLRDKLQLKV